MTYVSCPSCGNPAEISHYQNVVSTDGMVPHVRILCVTGEFWVMPLEMVREALEVKEG